MSGSTVGAPDGYSADSDTMQSAAGAIKEAADDAKSNVEKTGNTELTEQDFGEAHTKWHQKYSAGVEEIDAGATEMCVMLSSFAAQIKQARAEYDQAEAQQQAAIQNLERDM